MYSDFSFLAIGCTYWILVKNCKHSFIGQDLIGVKVNNCLRIILTINKLCYSVTRKELPKPGSPPANGGNGNSGAGNQDIEYCFKNVKQQKGLRILQASPRRSCFCQWQHHAGTHSPGGHDGVERGDLFEPACAASPVLGYARAGSGAPVCASM
jgi:hypothetical protein